MSRRMTEISVPGAFACGLADWDAVSVPDMIAKIRRHAAQLREQAEAIEATPDDAFRVTTYLGPYANRDLKVLQEGRSTLRTQGQTP